MIHLLKQTIMDKRKYQQMLLPLLLTVLVLVGGGGCSDNEEPVQEEYGCKVIKLNMADHRFEDLKTIHIITDTYCDICRVFERNDSVFISYYGALLYPTRLPDDFPVLSEAIIFSGTVKQKPNGVDFHPLILDEFKYLLNIEFEN